MKAREKITRFGVSLERALLGHFDQLIRRRHYENRSEAIRDLIRRELVSEEWERADSEVMGTVTMVYDHHSGDLTGRLTELQHDHAHEIVTTTHLHLDHHNCLEVLIIRGSAGRVRDLFERLRSERGVKHASLSTATTGASLR